ncbi:hypothetical protein VTO42DRAFT_7026 [Malbranchea cinnamomea]
MRFALISAAICFLFSSVWALPTAEDAAGSNLEARQNGKCWHKGAFCVDDSLCCDGRKCRNLRCVDP